MCMPGNYSNWGNWNYAPSNFQTAEIAADSNGSGTIRWGEFGNFLNQLRQNELGDINGDGETSRREGRAVQAFVNADGNGDGQITNNEFKKFRLELMRSLGRPVSKQEARFLQERLNEMQQQSYNSGYNFNSYDYNNQWNAWNN